jgi:predicted  nucleic acid-binding Zn-ribbon protein
LKKKVSHTVQDIKECEHDICDLEQTKESLKDQIEDAKKSIITLEERYKVMEVDVESANTRKNMYLNLVVVFQKLDRRYQDLTKNRYKFIYQDVDQRENEIEIQKTRMDNIFHVHSAVSKNEDQTITAVIQEMKNFGETALADLNKLYGFK